VGFFNWAAPVFHRFADRWDDAGVEEIAGWLAPFVHADGAVLDVGGGTGALAARLSSALGARVTVLDPTPQMLAYVPVGGMTDAVLGTAEELPFADDSFDALIVTDAFHHFSDQPAAAREFSRVVRRGGGVVVVELDPSGLIMRGIVMAEKLLGEPGAFFEPEQLCTFMSEHGIEGSCTRMRGAAYRFVGRVS
jgi:demethylmenaquinone methyltransferase/2-methoxy-6-polyprenyl-1,4-benzoquinol methylase